MDTFFEQFAYDSQEQDAGGANYCSSVDDDSDRQRSVPRETQAMSRYRREFEESRQLEELRRKAKRQRSEVSAHQLSKENRDMLFIEWYGESVRIALCVICQTNAVYFEKEAGFDCGHVAARAHGGESREMWNYVPCCHSCNSRQRTGNMLDDIERSYQTRLIAICHKLYEIYSNMYMSRGQSYEGSLERFVRDMYSGDDVAPEGRVQSASIFERLRSYDESFEQFTRHEVALSECSGVRSELEHDLTRVCDDMEETQRRIDEMRASLEHMRDHKRSIDKQLRQARIDEHQAKQTVETKRRTLDRACQLMKK